MSNLPIVSVGKPAEKLLILFWLAFCFLALIYKLGEVPPYHADENFYVESSLNMVESGDYLTPIYHGKKRFAKPVLYYWMVVSSYKIFGVSLTSARLPSALLGVFSIGLVYFLACRLFDSRVGLFSAFILPSMYLHFQISRWSTTDMALSFFILLALYFFVLLFQTNFQKSNYAYLFYLCLGLGFMVKGPPAIIIPGLTVLGFLFATGRKKWITELRIGSGLTILFITILPWFAAMIWMHGEEFKNHILGAELKGRLIHDTPFSFYYLGVLFRYQLPWSLFFIFAVLKQFGFLGLAIERGNSFIEQIKGLGINVGKQTKRLFNKENESVAFCYIWIFVCLIMFMLLRIEHSRYLLPSCPAIAMLTARIFASAEKIPGELDELGFRATFYITFFILLVFSILAGVGILISSLEFSIPFEISLLPVILIAGAAAIFLFSRLRLASRIVFSLALVLTLTFAILSGDTLPFVSRYPMKAFSGYINQENFKGPITVFRLGSHRARLGILTGRTVVKLYDPIQVREFLKAGQKFYLIVRETDWLENFSKSGLKIVMQDQIGKKTQINSGEILDVIKIEKLRKLLNSTETIYLMSNK